MLVLCEAATVCLPLKIRLRQDGGGSMETGLESDKKIEGTGERTNKRKTFCEGNSAATNVFD